MKDEIKNNEVTSYLIPNFETGGSLSVSKEEYEKFMETWEMFKPKWDEKWNDGKYELPSQLTYIPMEGIDYSYDAFVKEDHSVNNNPQLVFIDMNWNDNDNKKQ